MSSEDEEKSDAVSCCSSMTDYEQYLLMHEPHIAKQIALYDRHVAGASGSDPSSASSSKGAIKLPKGEERLASLQRIMKPSGEGNKNMSVLVDVKKKVHKTLLAALDNNSFEGPLAMLCKSVNDKIKIRVCIRGRMILRSILRGYLISFDKHWNLAMNDVEETFYRRKKTRIMAKGKQDAVNIENDLKYPEKLCYAPVNLRHRSKVEIWARHLNQVFVRGDEVITISLLR